MEKQENPVPLALKTAPWNKGKLIGSKPPLRSKHVWSIRTKLQVESRARDLAMFNLAIDSKLRGCDVVALKVEDIAPNGYTVDRATARQKKTGLPVRFELTEQTRQAVDEYTRRYFQSSLLPISSSAKVAKWLASPLPNPTDVHHRPGVAFEALAQSNQLRLVREEAEPGRRRSA